MSSFVNYRRNLDNLPGKWKQSPFEKKRVFLVVGKKRKNAFVDTNWTVIPYEYRIKKEKWKKKDNQIGCLLRQSGVQGIGNHV